jgi:hypothetical protein
LDTGKDKVLESMAKAELSLLRCENDHSMKDWVMQENLLMTTIQWFVVHIVRISDTILTIVGSDIQS